MCQDGKKCEKHDTEPCDACLPRMDAREAFVSGLVEKTGTHLLSREEAFVILQWTLSDMLGEAFPGMEKDHAATVEGTVERENSALFIDIAKKLQAEMVACIDHAMRRTGVLIKPGFVVMRPR